MDLVWFSYPQVVLAIMFPVSCYAAAVFVQYAREWRNGAVSDIVPVVMGLSGGAMTLLMSIYGMVLLRGTENMLACAAGAAGGVAGMAGGLLFRRRKTAAGVVMLAAAAAAWSTVAGAIALLLGAAGALSYKRQVLTRKWTLLSVLLIVLQLAVFALGIYRLVPPTAAMAASVAALIGWIVLAVFCILSQEKAQAGSSGGGM
jgi:hypothetical protein